MVEVLPHAHIKTEPQKPLGRLSTPIETSMRPAAREQFTKNLAERIKGADGPIIVNSHMRPDPDAVCSALAYKRHLQKLNPEKEFKVVFSEAPIKVYDRLQKEEGEIVWAGAEKKKGPDGKERAGDVADVGANTLKICLDGAEESRFSDVPDQLGTFIILDHHPAEPNKAEMSYNEPEASSTCELIARMYPVDSFDPDVAGLLWLGIIKDTQNFKIPKDFGDTIDLAAKLLVRSGKSAEELHSLIPKSDQQKIYVESYKRHITHVEREGMPKSTYSFLTTSELNPTAPTENMQYDRLEARRDFMFDLSQSGQSELYWTIIPVRPGSKYSISFRRSNDSSIDLNKLSKRLSGDNKSGGHIEAASTTIILPAEAMRHIRDQKTQDPNFNETEFVNNLVIDALQHIFSGKAPSKPERPERKTQQPPSEHKAAEQAAHH